MEDVDTVAAKPETQQQQLRCPRCESSNTKFCYYNNYNLSQPRHYCRDCRRYWTHGGTLRNVPVGGATRKNSKRSNNNPKRLSKPVTDRLLDTAAPSAGSFSELLASDGGDNPTLPPELANDQGDYSCCWTGGWADLAIYTNPGSGLQ